MRLRRPLNRALRALAWASPQLAGKAAAELFFAAPPRRTPSASEVQVLARGERFDIPMGRESIAAWRWGEDGATAGPVVVLLHGWGGSAAQMSPFVDPLLQSGFSVIAFDAPGHGHSSGRQSSLVLFALALEGVVAAVGPVFGVVAHSIGGMATTFALSRGLAVDRAVILGPTSNALAWFERFAAAMLSDPSAIAATRLEIERQVGFTFAELDIETFGSKVTSEVLVVHDRTDREVSWEEGKVISQQIAGARLVTTHGLGHRRILRAEVAIQHALDFLATGRCDRCGQPNVSDGACPCCTLAIELFDREARIRRVA